MSPTFFLSSENFGKILSTWGSVVEVMPYLALYLSYVSAAHCLLCSVHAECSSVLLLSFVHFHSHTSAELWGAENLRLE